MSDKAMEGVAIALAAQSPTLLPGEQGTVSVSMRGYGGHAAVGLGAAMRLGDSNTQLFGSMEATKSHAGGAVELRFSWQSVEKIKPINGLISIVLRPFLSLRAHKRISDLKKPRIPA